jgi:hypothetical protein
VRRILGVAKDVTPEPPRPLTRELPPADPFPVDTLGDVLASAARAIHDRVQAPLAIGAQSALGAAALAVQGHADVVLPIGPGQSRPLTCYLITIALSGERKRMRHRGDVADPPARDRTASAARNRLCALYR